MKKLIICGVALMFILTALSSCSKYEEGPKLTLLSKKARLTGDWKLTKTIVNGIEQDISGSTRTISIIDDGKYKSNVAYILLGEVYNVPSDGTWKFSDDKTQIIIIETGNSSGDTATIVRLASKELKFKTISGSNTSIATWSAQ